MVWVPGVGLVVVAWGGGGGEGRYDDGGVGDQHHHGRGGGFKHLGDGNSFQIDHKEEMVLLYLPCKTFSRGPSGLTLCKVEED